MGSVFDDRPGDYERHAARSAYNALYDRPAVLDLLGPVEGLVVLDAGCGPGLYAEELAARGARVIGFDRSPGMVELARARLGRHAELRVHDLADPLGWLPDASVDAVVLALVIHHVDDRVAALRELWRVLRPGGHLVLSTHHPTTDWLRLGGSYFAVDVVEEVWNDGWQVRYWRMPLTRVCAEVAEAGFLVERLVEPRPHPAMAEAYPDHFAKLSAEPAFVVLRLLRPPAPTAATRA